MASSKRVSSRELPSSFYSWEYDVFLSFRGEDTRKNFTDHLYDALNRKGINVFRDDKELERGKAISPGLLKAIEESRSSIIVFSRNYAYSIWCLDELVKIVECKNTSEQMVFPIFYDVEPTAVRKQTGSFQQAFAKHEETFRENMEKVQKWRETLREVANLSGWELKDRHEVEFIQEIVKEISTKLRPTTLRTLDGLVGINSRVEKLQLLIDLGSNDVRMVGIWGMGGIGKTTIARIVYDMISNEFEGSSFLANVREISEKDGLISLQKQLLEDVLLVTDIKIHNDLDGIQIINSKLQRKRVLIVVDDVVHLSQLNKLVGNHSWFGFGSRIIITTRDEHLLRAHRVDHVYKAQALNNDEAFELFNLKAFDSDQPSEEYVVLANYVVKYVDGLPLALNVLGSFLFGRTIDEWKSALERLNRDSEDEILDMLQISFDGLKETEKRIFLDISCFFKGRDRDYVIKILDGCGFDPVIGIRVLIDKSLLTIVNENILWMHDLLQEMGQQIVNRKSPEEPGRRCRLWNHTDIHHVLTENTGTEVIEGIILESTKDEMHLRASAKVFSKMTKIRLLKIRNVQLPEGLEYLPNQLRLLEWHGFPLKSLPSSLQMDKIVEFNMPYSLIKQLWNGIKTLNYLKFITLGQSKNLIKIPDLSGVQNLEELILPGCTRLHEIHPSLFVHKKLIVLNLQGCESLKTLPSKISMESLRTLLLSGCSKLKKFPEIVGNMKYLSELLLDGTAIKELPESIKHLSGLVLLNLNDCINLERLPCSISGFKSLRTLKLSGCSKLENVLENLGQVESMEELDISGTAITQPKSSISFMKKLKEVSFRGCKGQPSSTSWYFPLPFNLKPSRSSDPLAIILQSLSGLHSLRKLDLRDCNLGEGAIPSDICNLVSLRDLYLSKNNFVSLPGTINRLSNLEYLYLEDCKRLQSLPELPSRTREVRVDGCSSLETLSDAFKSCKSENPSINCRNCLKLIGYNSFVAFSTLKEFLEGESDPIDQLSIVVPGSQIPGWFSCQNEGSSISILRPPNSYKNYNFAGYAVCCVFRVHKHTPFRQKLFAYTHKLQLHVIDGMRGDDCYSLASMADFDVQSGGTMSDHLWLQYLSYDRLSNEPYWFPLKKSPNAGEIFTCFHIKFIIESYLAPGLEVKRCGVHPVYVHQVEEFNQATKQQWINYGYSFLEMDEFHQKFDESLPILQLLSQTLDMNLQDGAEASGSDCSLQ